MKYLQPLLILVLAVLCVHLWKMKSAAVKTHEDNLGVLNDSISHYKNKEGLWVAERKAFQGEKKELEELIKTQGEQLKKAVKQFKQPAAAVKIKTVVEVDTVLVPYVNKTELDFHLPFDRTTEHYSLKGFVSNAGVSFLSVEIPNEQSVIVGKKKTGFLKYEYRAEVTNSNPLIKVTELSSFNFMDKKIRFHLGPYVGIGSNGSVAFGIGVGYSFLSF